MFSACTSFISLIKAGAVGAVKNEPKDMKTGELSLSLASEGGEGGRKSRGEQTGRSVKPSPLT